MKIINKSPMENFKKIENKIFQLGGMKENPLCPDKDESFDVDMLFSELETLVNAKLPEDYKLFYKKFGACSFKKSIKVKCEQLNPAADKNKVTVDYFYKVGKDGQCTIGELLIKYAGQLNNKFLPICDGESGDLICIDLRDKSYGSIFYWYHEGVPNRDLFLIAENFEYFILKLEISEDVVDQDSDILDKIQVTTSPEILEMLRKSGLGPKKGDNAK